MNVQSLVTVSLVKDWLYGEEENVRPYLVAWKGVNPYDTIGRKRFFFWIMICIALTIVVGMYYMTQGNMQALLFACGITALVSGFIFWRSANADLQKFCSAVAWCENRKIPHHLLQRTMWTNENVYDVLRFFVPYIQENILPLEQEYIQDSMFPRRSQDARREHDRRKTYITKEISKISHMFGDFKGINSPLAEAFRLANTK